MQWGYEWCLLISRVSAEQIRQSAQLAVPAVGRRMYPRTETPETICENPKLM